MVSAVFIREQLAICASILIYIEYYLVFQLIVGGLDVTSPLTRTQVLSNKNGTNHAFSNQRYGVDGLHFVTVGKGHLTVL